MCLVGGLEEWRERDASTQDDSTASGYGIVGFRMILISAQMTWLAWSIGYNAQVRGQALPQMLRHP